MDPAELDEVRGRWMAAMKAGDFEAAWRQTDCIEAERRALEAAGRFESRPYYLAWNGMPFDAQRVLVRCSHGLGDTLQFVRYVPFLRARSVCLLVQPHLVALFTGAGEFGDVRSAWDDESPRPHDIEIEVMELPYAFRSTAATLPNAVPYLPLRNLDGREPPVSTLVDEERLKVGLLWAASEWDTRRSIPLERLAPLARVRGAKFYSLQQGPQRERWRAGPVPLEPLHRWTETVAAAGAAMQKLDLVITVDGMAAHLAGALARPVWVLLRHEADWRWMSGRTDSPWYPTMRLFRQSRPGDWLPVVEAVAAELDALCRRRRLSVEVSTRCR